MGVIFTLYPVFFRCLKAMISIPWSPELWVSFILENAFRFSIFAHCIQIHIHPCVESPVLYKIGIAVLVNDTFKRIAIDVVHIAIYYICNIPFIEIQENTVSNEMAGVTVFS